MDLFVEFVNCFLVFLKILLELLVVQVMPDRKISGDDDQFLLIN
jgi:hypothetical protein